MAERIKTILPKPSLEECIEITKIQSIKGILDKCSIVEERPFRSPHHSITMTGLIGGGQYPLPGEISLAHLGILFLDEILEFDSTVLDTLRIPIENKKINITRNEMSVTYPSSFILIGSTNPCPCGYYGSKEKECKCSESQRRRYINKMSGPLMDRIDLRVAVSNVDYNSKEFKNMKNESSEVIRQRVEKARKIQKRRYGNYPFSTNGELDEKGIKDFCVLSRDAENILNRGAETLKFSMRAYSKIKKVARTIADIDGEPMIEKRHILEALQYRKEI